MAQELIPVQAAREMVLQRISPLDSEEVALEDALGRVLAEEVRAAGDVPPFACSAMDGYALKAGPAGRTMEVVGEARAGAPSSTPVKDGQAIRISTGAAVPEGATAVIRQEDVHAAKEAAQIQTQTDTPEGHNVRPAGEDLRAGDAVLTPGQILDFAALGTAVGAGAATLSLARRPRVAVLCTGDELRAPGEPLGPGEIHNSNAPMLRALATKCGGAPQPARRLPDDRKATEAEISGALERCDVVLLSGGVSVGPHDHVRPALESLGVEEVFWGLALQPGKPTWFGTRGERLVFGLPGNPVSAVVTFTLLAGPAIWALQGVAISQTPRRHAVLGAAVRRNPAREQAIRVRLEQLDGAMVALPNGPQGSHIVSSLVGADALAMIPAGEGELGAGAVVELEELPR